MFERLANHKEALVVIAIALGMTLLLFICQFIARWILWTIRKITPTAYAGEEIVKILQEENQTNIDVIERNYFLFSAYYSYNKKKETLTFSKVRLKRNDMDTIIKILLSFVFMDEKQNKIPKITWQLIFLNILSAFPYLLTIGVVILIKAPSLEVLNSDFGARYYVIAEVLAIVSFVLVIAIAFWWSYTLRPIQKQIEIALEKIQNRSLHALILNHYKTCSYIPFSLRLML